MSENGNDGGKFPMETVWLPESMPSSLHIYSVFTQHSITTCVLAIDTETHSIIIIRDIHKAPCL